MLHLCTQTQNVTKHKNLMFYHFPKAVTAFAHVCMLPMCACMPVCIIRKMINVTFLCTQTQKCTKM